MVSVDTQISTATAFLSGAVASSFGKGPLDGISGSATESQQLDGTADYAALFASFVNGAANTGTASLNEAYSLNASQQASLQLGAVQRVVSVAPAAGLALDPTSPPQSISPLLTATGPFAETAAPAFAETTSFAQQREAGPITDPLTAGEPLFGLSLSYAGSVINEPGSAAFTELQSAAPLPQASAANLTAQQPTLDQITRSGITLQPEDFIALNINPSGQETHFLPRGQLAALHAVAPALSQTITVEANASVAPLTEDVLAQSAQAAPTSTGQNDTLNNALTEKISERTSADLTRADLKSATEYNASPEDAVLDAEAEAQILAVQKAAQKNGTAAQQSGQNQQANAATQPQTQAQTQAQAALAAAQPQRQTDTGLTRAEDRADKAKGKPFVDELISAAGRSSLPETATATRTAAGSFNPWSGGWTPERVAGLPEGVGSDAIAGGLSGLRGDGAGFGGLTVFGGRANPALGSHVARQLNVNVTRAVKAGEQEFAVRLDPAELGKVTVKLRFDAEGVVRAHVFAERPETVELLQREVRGLERALEAGGNKASDDGISFSLDQGNEQSAGRAFAEAVQQEKLQEQAAGHAGGITGSDIADTSYEEDATPVDLEEILAHVTPETGLDVHI